jgi:hypothetical protein
MDIEVLFPTLIGMEQADASTVQAIEREVLQQEEFLKSHLSYSWGDNVLTSFDKVKNIFEVAQLHALQAFVERSVLEFVKQTRKNSRLMIDARHTQSWINVTRKFGYQERHNHDRTVEGLPISGVYYFKTNGNDGNLGIFPSDAQTKLFSTFEVQPAVGRLLLFRSEVFHRVAANLTDEDRISFAFNLVLTPDEA